MGQKIADWVAATMGSWTFIIVQSFLLMIWIVLNVTAFVERWDPYPFILLNLALSFQAAYAAPFIMMAQNRQQEIDRKEAENDYKINIKAELEIELLHQKIDELRQREVLSLTNAISQLTTLLARNKSASDETAGGRKAPGRTAHDTARRRPPTERFSGSVSGPGLWTYRKLGQPAVWRARRYLRQATLSARPRRLAVSSADRQAACSSGQGRSRLRFKTVARLTASRPALSG